MAFRMRGQIAFRCEKDLQDRWQEYADRNGRNASIMAREILEIWLDRKESEETRLEKEQAELDEIQRANKLKRAKRT